MRLSRAASPPISACTSSTCSRTSSVRRAAKCGAPARAHAPPVILMCGRATIRWFLSVDRNDLPPRVAKGKRQRTVRSPSMMTKSNFRKGSPICIRAATRRSSPAAASALADVRPSVDIVSDFRKAPSRFGGASVIHSLRDILHERVSQIARLAFSGRSYSRKFIRRRAGADREGHQASGTSATFSASASIGSNCSIGQNVMIGPRVSDR